MYPMLIEEVLMIGEVAPNIGKIALNGEVVLNCEHCDDRL